MASLTDWGSTPIRKRALTHSLWPTERKATFPSIVWRFSTEESL